MHFGRPTPEQCEAFTRVLQGHVRTFQTQMGANADNKHAAHAQIAIDSAIFPEGTSGAKLDVLARKALWQDGLNYMVRN